MMFENWCGTCHHNLDQHTGPDGSCISRFNPGDRICLCAGFVPAELPRLRATLDAQAQALATLRAERDRLREALEIITGKRPCLDNLMSNVDVALAALTPAAEQGQQES